MEFSDPNPYEPSTESGGAIQITPKTRATKLDKFCFVFSFALGIPLLILGIFGLFGGCSAHFTLPPVLGVLPAIVGWGILRAVWVAWKAG